MNNGWFKNPFVTSSKHKIIRNNQSLCVSFRYWVCFFISNFYSLSGRFPGDDPSKSCVAAHLPCPKYAPFHLLHWLFRMLRATIPQFRSTCPRIRAVSTYQGHTTFGRALRHPWQVKPALTFSNQEFVRQPLSQHWTHSAERWTHCADWVDLKKRISGLDRAE